MKGSFRGRSYYMGEAIGETLCAGGIESKRNGNDSLRGSKDLDASITWT